MNILNTLRTPIILCLALLIFAQVLYAQKIDHERMERDLRVAENVLTTLIKKEMGDRYFSSKGKVQGHYLEGYGVIFSLPRQSRFIATVQGNPEMSNIRMDFRPGMEDIRQNLSGIDFQPVMEDIRQTLSEVKIQLQGRAYGDWDAMDWEEDFDGDHKHVKIKILKDSSEWERELDEGIEKSIEEAMAHQGKTYRFMYSDHEGGKTEADLEGFNRAIQTFLLDYSDMISQLKADEKIRISEKEGKPFPIAQHGSPKLLQVEVKKSDLEAFRTGKISQEEAITRIKDVSGESGGKSKVDLDIVKDIFGNLYKSENSFNYFISTPITLEYLEGHGAIYSMEFFASNKNTITGKYNLPSARQNGLSFQERNDVVKDLYPMFEKDFQENILDYGRTIKSLKEGERLVFRAKMTECNNCGIPKALEVRVTAKTLADYASGKADKKKALNQMDLRRVGEQ